MSKSNGSKRSRAAASKEPLRPRSISANMEDYMEAIYVLIQRDGACRVSEIAAKLEVKRPSVSKALKRLCRQGLVSHSPYGDVSMTGRGKRVARQQVRTHRVLTSFLADVLKLPPELAEHDACLIEHAISRETVERLVEFVDHLKLRGGRSKTFRQHARRRLRTGQARGTRRTWKSRV